MSLYLACGMTMAMETAYFLLIGYRDRDFLIVCLAAAAIMVILHFLLTFYGDDDNSHRLTYAFIFGCWGIALYRYYNDRRHLFVN